MTYLSAPLAQPIASAHGIVHHEQFEFRPSSVPASADDRLGTRRSTRQRATERGRRRRLLPRRSECGPCAASAACGAPRREGRLTSAARHQHMHFAGICTEWRFASCISDVMAHGRCRDAADGSVPGLLAMSGRGRARSAPPPGTRQPRQEPGCRPRLERRRGLRRSVVPTASVARIPAV